MKILTVLGTRPEIIRLSQIIPKLDDYASHTLLHTGQNYDANLSDIFFSELKLRKPDIYLGVRGAGFGEQAGMLFTEGEKVLKEVKPDRILILGDTNSGLLGVVAKRLGIPVFHMEAGNRCFDDRVPEEVNRKIIDHCSTILLPYTHNSKENLLAEGISGNRIYVTGNPIHEVIQFYEKRMQERDTLSLQDLRPKQYFLVTLHRAENVDQETTLRNVISALETLYKKYEFPVIFSVHPRTQDKLTSFGIRSGEKGIRFLKPLSFFDFVNLEKNAFCVLSDSGTVQEECCLFRVPTVTMREVTERPETVECGSNLISGTETDRILQAVRLVVEAPCDWQPPREYLEKHVSDTVTRIMTGFNVCANQGKANHVGNFSGASASGNKTTSFQR